MHGNCGKQPKHTISADIKSKIWEIWNILELEECNFTHFQEILEEDYNIKISYTALSNFLKAKGAKSPRKHKKAKTHNRRQERPSAGELLQVDGTPHQFFYCDPKEYCLHGFIDDATHQVTGLYMCENECMHGYLEVTRQTFKNFGVPLALYADGSSIFFPKDKKLTIEEQLAGITEPTTQYSRIDLEQNLEDTILQPLKKQTNFLKRIFQNLIKNLLLSLKIKQHLLWNYQNMSI